jgi:hypothetical protein
MDLPIPGILMLPHFPYRFGRELKDRVIRKTKALGNPLRRCLGLIGIAALTGVLLMLAVMKEEDLP